MKQFNRKMHLALLGGALLGAAMMPSVVSAKPFPKRGYILKDKSTADIGRRTSELDAQRAALRMMARMMKRAPKERYYGVDWRVLDSKGVSQFYAISFGDDDGYKNDDFDDGHRKKTLTLYGDFYAIYGPITRKIIYCVASYNGSLRDLKRYGVIDQVNGTEEEVNR